MGRVLAAAVGVVTFIAAIFAILDSEAATEVAEFLWPIGVLALVATVCLVVGFLYGRRHPGASGGEEAGSSPHRRQRWDVPAKDVPEPPESASTREKREAAYDAILLTSEAYINAHREYATYDDAQPTSYVPEIQEAAAAAHVADQQFVRARQLVELYGVDPVLGAALAVEAAVNDGNLDAAAETRTQRLVPEVRKDQNRSRASFL